MKGTSAFGWRGKFGCPLVVGDAVFIPAKGQEDNLRSGNSIAVETGHEDISGFRVLNGDGGGKESMQPLPMPGDYLVRGLIVHCAPAGNVRVSVKGLEFTLERAELGGAQPAVGDTVEFALHGLSFWDMAQ